MVCDRVAILVDGRLRSCGRLEELVSRRIHGFEVTCERVEPGRLAAELVWRDERQVLLRLPDAEALERFLADVREQGGVVTSVWPRRDTLEDLFLEQVGRGGVPAERSSR
jgi:ABC-type multidrug transport system ATPase subunit